MLVFRPWTWLEPSRNSQAEEKERREGTFELRAQQGEGRRGGRAHPASCMVGMLKGRGRAVPEFKPGRKGEHR